MKDERGFTLIEVVISIFAIVLMSNFIIRMFLVSAQLNQTVHLVDQSAAFACSLVEEFKADPENVRVNLQNNGTQSAEDTYVLYYSADWQPATLTTARYQLTAIWQAQPQYSLAVPEVPGQEADIVQGIIDFRVSVSRVERGQVTDTLVSYATKKYTAWPKEAYDV